MNNKLRAELFFPFQLTWQPGGGHGQHRLCIFINFCRFWNIVYFEDRESITTKQWGRTAHPLWDTKSTTLTGADNSNSTGGSAGTVSLAGNLSSRMVSS